MEGETLEVAKEFSIAMSKAGRLFELVEAMPEPVSALNMASIRQAVRTMTEGGAWHGDLLQVMPENVVLAWKLVEYIRLHGLDLSLVLVT